MFYQVRFVAMGMQGWRRTMEDSHIAHTDLDNGVSLFGVFDGHGGESYKSLFVRQFRPDHSLQAMG